MTASAATEHLERLIASQMIEAGMSPDIAPTPARIAVERMVKGESGDTVVRDLMAEFGVTKAAQVKAEPVQEPRPKTGMRAPPSRDRTAERIRSATSAGNPWAAGSISLTRQTMVEAADPALAARLRSEADR